MRWLVFLLLAAPAYAETVVATRTIRPQEILSPGDVKIDPSTVSGAHASLDEVLGLEARVAIYPGRAVMRGSLGKPALIERNQVVEIVFENGALRIATEGRALGRAGLGERVRIMNLSSRTVLFGTVASDGSVRVSR